MTDREVWQLAKDLVDTFMPTKGKTGEQIIAEIHRVYADLLEKQWTPAPSIDDADALDPETGLLREARMLPFLRRWIAEAEAEAGPGSDGDPPAEDGSHRILRDPSRTTVRHSSFAERPLCDAVFRLESKADGLPGADGRDIMMGIRNTSSAAGTVLLSRAGRALRITRGLDHTRRFALRDQDVRIGRGLRRA